MQPRAGAIRNELAKQQQCKTPIALRQQHRHGAQARPSVERGQNREEAEDDSADTVHVAAVIGLGFAVCISQQFGLGGSGLGGALGFLGGLGPGLGRAPRLRRRLAAAASLNHGGGREREGGEAARGGEEQAVGVDEQFVYSCPPY